VGCENSVAQIRWPRLNEATALSAWRSKIDSGVLAGSRRGSGEVGQVSHRESTQWTFGRDRRKGLFVLTAEECARVLHTEMQPIKLLD